LLKAIDDADGGNTANVSSVLSEAQGKPKAKKKPVFSQNKKVKEGAIDVAKAPAKKEESEEESED
tara:strand:+ start:778 stop:972 length:195 start_codon:yes stop_codon:yes gene_type:complete